MCIRDRLWILSNAWAEFPYRKYPAQPRRNRFMSCTTSSTGAANRARIVMNRMRSRACCIALRDGQRARKVIWLVPWTGRECTSRWWKPRKSNPSPPSVRCTILVLACFGCKPRSARKLVSHLWRRRRARARSSSAAAFSSLEPGGELPAEVADPLEHPAGRAQQGCATLRAPRVPGRDHLRLGAFGARGPNLPEQRDHELVRCGT